MNQPTSFRLSADARYILLEISKRWGVSQRAALEILLRDSAKTEGVSVLNRKKGDENRRQS